MYEGTVKSTATPYLNVRNAPNGTKVGQLKPGEAVVVEYVENGWAKVISPVVSNNPDRQWALAAYMDLAEQTDPGTPGGEDPPTGEVPQPARTDAIHLSFGYDAEGNLVKINCLEQFNDGTDLAREFFPDA